MDDLISRKAAIDAIGGEPKYKVRLFRKTYAEGRADQWWLDIGAIHRLPSAEPQRWIPVTERLPVIENNIGKRVLVTTSWGMACEAWYCKDHWEIHDISYKLTSVIAWQPLPEPYKGGDSSCTS